MIRIDASEIEALRQRLAGLTRLDMRTMLRRSGKDIAARTKERLERDKYSPDGVPWDPWSASYAASGRGKSLLDRTGAMKRSIRPYNTRKTLAVEAFSPYAKYHQSGTKKMPARPFLGIGPEEIEILETRAIELLEKAFK